MALASVAFLFVDDVSSRFALLALSPLIAVATVIDFGTLRIPTRLTSAAGVITGSTCAATALVRGSWTPLIGGLLAAVAVGVVFLALWRFAGLGLGDVRLAVALAPVTGAVGWQTVVAFVVAAHLIAAPLALWALARRRRDVPFGPGIVGGLYVAVAITPLL